LTRLSEGKMLNCIMSHVQKASKATNSCRLLLCGQPFQWRLARVHTRRTTRRL